jgi:hypothetical protein
LKYYFHTRLIPVSGKTFDLNHLCNLYVLARSFTYARTHTYTRAHTANMTFCLGFKLRCIAVCVPFRQEVAVSCVVEIFWVLPVLSGYDPVSLSTQSIVPENKPKVPQVLAQNDMFPDYFNRILHTDQRLIYLAMFNIYKTPN